MAEGASHQTAQRRHKAQQRRSAVAQEILLGIAATAGLDTQLCWAPDAPLPFSWELGFALATDDLLLFSDRGPGGADSATARFEHTLRLHGAVKHEGKDIDDALNATYIGIDLVEGTH